MHYLINVIVKGESVTEALQNAKYGAEEMTDQQHGADFDWYDMDGRWGASEAHKITSTTGKGLLARGMKTTREEFGNAIKACLYMLENYSDDQIFNEDFGDWDDVKDKLPEGIFSLSRWQFSRAGGHGNCCYVYAPDYDIWGGKVENQKDLNSILEKNNNLWVVPIDFHN